MIQFDMSLQNTTYTSLTYAELHVYIYITYSIYIYTVAQILQQSTNELPKATDTNQLVPNHLESMINTIAFS